jgi:hypothetical protein
MTQHSTSASAYYDQLLIVARAGRAKATSELAQSQWDETIKKIELQLKHSEISGKSLSVEASLEGLFGRSTALGTNTCTSCRKQVAGFRDRLSQREYSLSGLCQSCQDIAFAPMADDG